ncbi:MAG: hypothetical protein ACT4QG_10760 [Sporichthyaceae bacterium]
MRDDLQFAALHSDDALLDALGARATGAALGVATGVDSSAEGDPVARLLGAWAHEVDTRPGPLTHLLGEVEQAGAERPLTAVEPGVTHLHRRPRRRALPRAVAAATASILVLGIGGVAAAVSGGTPFESLRQFVGAAPEVSDAETPAQRASALLVGAKDALDAGNLMLAAERFAGAQELLPEVSDAKEARTLRAQLAAFRARWEKVVAPVSAAVSKAEQQAEKGAVPGAVEKRSGVPDEQILPDSFDSRRPQLVPEAGMDDPSDRLTLPDPGLEDEKGDRLESAKQGLEDGKGERLEGAKQGLEDTREDLKDRAGDKVEQLPKRNEPRKQLPGDLPGPLSGVGPDDLLFR